MLVRTCTHVGQGTNASRRQNPRCHIHALTSEGQEQAQYFTPITLVFLGSSYRRVAAHTTLPNRIRDLGCPILLRREGEVAEEEQVNERVDQLLG